jgi:hypothetical protein
MPYNGGLRVGKAHSISKTLDKMLQVEIESMVVNQTTRTFHPGTSGWRETGARARSAKVGDTLYFTNIPGVSFTNHHLMSDTSGRVKYSSQTLGFTHGKPCTTNNAPARSTSRVTMTLPALPPPPNSDIRLHRHGPQGTDR